MTIKHEFEISVISEQIIALNLLDEAFSTEDTFLSHPLSREKIKQIMQKGCVWLEKEGYTQRLRRAKKVLKKGETLYCYYNGDVLNLTPQEAQLLSDQGDYSIWNKPSGMLSQGSKWGDHCTIYRWAEKTLKPERPAFIVHRLDRAASGLIILAHKKKTAAQFAKMFQLREIEKHYQVKVQGDFSQCFLEALDSEKTVTEPIDDKTAISHVRFLDYDKNENRSLLDVRLETGRKHQIRIHLSGLGFPVIADRLYGNEQKNSENDLQLKAVLLKFLCPIKKETVVFKL